ncbi:pilus assembly protein N-terminal domain-containing protein [Pseudoalteromonas sp. ZZD1]|uniref:pilus assembly protein N-terminal domain-containing protein n=1 Tax=Pseudoalteromonas sp. ZZD1 TaxID=3139395 RepID=UPI003BAB37AD
MKAHQFISLACLLLASNVPNLDAKSQGLAFIETANGEQSTEIREMVQWTHSRLVFNKLIERVAVGEDSILQLEVLDNNEVLALAKKVGRTSIIVWYTDKTSETFLVSVTEDLSVLNQALHDIHPEIKLTLAPDRAALVLRGNVPTIKYRIAAERAARHYLEAGQSIQDNNLVMQSAGANILSTLTNRFNMKKTDNITNANLRKNAAIINLIKVENLPLSIDEKITNAIATMGGHSVKVERIQQGELPSDNEDTILLTGQVETQVELVRVLNVAAKLLSNNQPQVAQQLNGAALNTAASASDDGITVLANESGGVINGTTNTSVSNVSSNIARAKMLSLAGGRLLSTIEVRDLPQIRVAIQMYEVNRRKLKQWRPELSLITNGYDKDSGLFGLDGSQSRAQGAGLVENALQIVGGSFVNNLQLGGSEMAFDLLFSMMEEQGISRTLSRPTLTVLAGESAVFKAGGEVPVPTAFSPSGYSSDDNGQASGVFSGTEFKSFGVELQVRAMVDEKDRITLDLNPTISMPDTLLTQEIAGSTGSSLTTSAFNVRSLTTSTRLQDGQPLVIGGLVSQDSTNNMDAVPGVSDIPVFGQLAKATSEGETQKELIIIVTPTIVREPRHEVRLWQFPQSGELLQRISPSNTQS